MARSVAIVLVAALSGCQIVLDDVPLGTCRGDNDCSEIRDEGDPASCSPYFCGADDKCERRARGTEQCDGLDNDCDGVVDERVLAPRTGPDGSLELDEEATISFAPALGGGLLGGIVQRSMTHLGVLRTGSTTAPNPVEQYLSSTTVEACTCRMDEEPCAERCGPDDALLIGTSGESTLATLITRENCAIPALRPGTIEDAAMGPLRIPPGEMGFPLAIDQVKYDDRMIATPIPGCTSRGASGTSMSMWEAELAVESPPARALLAWVDCPRSTAEECRDSTTLAPLPRAVRITALFRSADEDVRLPDAVDMPVVENSLALDEDPSPDTRPGVVAIRHGHVLGYGGEDGRIHLYFVPLADFAMRPGRIGAVVPLGSVDPAMGGNIGALVLSLGPDPTQLGMAWTERRMGTTVLAFRRITLDADITRAPSGITAQGVVVVVDDAVAGTPAMIFVAQGFTTPSFERSGRSGGDWPGGWIIAWRDSSNRLVAARIWSGDGERLSSDERATFAEATTGDPFLYIEDETVHFAARTLTAATTNALCGAARSVED